MLKFNNNINFYHNLRQPEEYSISYFKQNLFKEFENVEEMISNKLHLIDLNV